MGDAMDDQPIRDRRILESLEACRPGAGDVTDPEFAHLAEALAADPELRGLYERLQRTDAVLARCIRDVPVPEGLAERLTLRLAAARTECEAEDAAAPRPARRFSRRWLAVSGALLTAAAAALVVALIDRGGPPLASDPDTIHRDAIDFFNAETPEAGYAISEESPPRGYEFSPELRKPGGMRWRNVRGFLGRTGVAYDLRVGGTTATLYVVRCVAPDLPRAPSEAPLVTGDCAVSAWQSGDCLYVLVVSGGTESYRQFLPRGPLT
jgi:hypothetical protein